MIKEDRYQSIRIVDKLTIRNSVDMAKMIRKLLENVPEEHLEGLDSIILVDWLLGTQHRNDPFLYRKQSKSTPANIELSLNGIYQNYPKVFSLIPFARKIVPALNIYKAVGDHYAHIKGDVAKNEREAFIKEYIKPNMRKTFPTSGRMVKILWRADRQV